MFPTLRPLVATSSILCRRGGAARLGIGQDGRLLSLRGAHDVASTSTMKRGTCRAQTLPSATTLIRQYSSGKNDRHSKGKRSKDIDRLLNELDEDADDEGEAVQNQDAEMTFVDTPAANFIGDFEKNHRKADGKAKSKKASFSHALAIEYGDVRKVMDVEKYWYELEGVVKRQRDHFVHHLSIRSVNALDNLPINLEGDDFPLKEIASISKRDPKRLVIDCSTFPQATVEVVKALRSSTLNVNPQQEGTRIYVPVPKVTKEHREQLVKSAKERFNETKVELKAVENKFSKIVGDLELSGKAHLPKDLFLGVKRVLVGMEQHFVALANEDLHKKQQEILGKS